MYIHCTIKSMKLDGRGSFSSEILFQIRLTYLSAIPPKTSSRPFVIVNDGILPSYSSLAVKRHPSNHHFAPA